MYKIFIYIITQTKGLEYKFYGKFVNSGTTVGF